jgi:hypothetical protein
VVVSLAPDSLTRSVAWGSTTAPEAGAMISRRAGVAGRVSAGAEGEADEQAASSTAARATITVPVAPRPVRPDLLQTAARAAGRSGRTAVVGERAPVAATTAGSLTAAGVRQRLLIC